MGELSWNALKQMVYERANGCCEYCQTCEVNSGQTMQVDHIDPQGDSSTRLESNRTCYCHPAEDEPSNHGRGTAALGGRWLSSPVHSVAEGWR